MRQQADSIQLKIVHQIKYTKYINSIVNFSPHTAPLLYKIYDVIIESVCMEHNDVSYILYLQ